MQPMYTGGEVMPARHVTVALHERDTSGHMRKVLATLSLCVLFSCASAGDDDNLSQTGTVSGKTVDWEAGSVTEEGQSTHLFIVNRAIGILGNHLSDAHAASAYNRLTDSACRSRWQQGLYDADHKVSYNNWYTFASHFYDPSTGTNYLGNSSPIAYTSALDHLATAKAKLVANDVKNGCYELGLSLHYATDITAPMHAVNFAATDWPLDLHSHIEQRAVAIQNSYAVSDWTGAPTTNVNDTLSAIAWASYDEWPPLWNALDKAYTATCDYSIDDYTFDHTSCWQGDSGVDAAIGVALRQAQASTAAYIYAADLH
jgi:phospholipase C